MRRFVFLGWMILAALTAFSQQTLTVSDSVMLEEVVSYGSLRKYQSGAKIENISGLQFSNAGDDNLEQLLSKTLPIAFKTDAGGLSAIRIRGTAASHTSVSFGGLDINSLTLGQSNFSNIPVYLFDNIGVQFGSASSVNGSGSIGGAIHLGLVNNWTNGFKAETRISHGSFGEQLYGTKIFVGNGRFESVTRAYYYYKKNDFKFKSSLKDFETQVVGFTDTQRNADIEKMGLIQELNYKFTHNEYFVFNVWLENDWHLQQQNMGVNFKEKDKREEYRDTRALIWTGYKNRKNPLKFEINGGYVFDDAVNNGNRNDTIRTQRIVGEAFIEHDFSDRGSYKVGAKAARIRPTVHAYAETLDHEDRIDFYASWYQRFFNTLSMTLNLRQGFVSDFKVPFTPSLGMSLRAISKESWGLNFSGSVSRSYRAPTFNDRFWVPGGNPDLAPEKGMSYELGTRLGYCTGDISGNIKLNAFYMNIDNWILWKNGGSFWYVENVQNVVSRGLELMTDWKFDLFNLPFTSGLNYSLTSTQRVKSPGHTNALKRQLEYVPLHSGNFFVNTGWKTLTVGLNGSYTGKQYTDEDDHNILDAYILLDLNASCQVKFSENNKIRFTGAINNILDTAYQSSWGYAMPGISYRLAMTYQFK